MTNDLTHDELSSLLGAYALGATDAAEARAIEDHVRSCESCASELDQHLHVASMLTLTKDEFEFDTGPLAEAPPAELWHRIDEATEDHRSNRTVGSILLVAAAIAALVGFGIQTVRVGDLTAEVTALEQEVDAPVDFDALVAADLGRTITLMDDSGDPVAVLQLSDDGRGIVVDSELSPPRDDRTYQLWAVMDGEVVSAGLLSQDPVATPFRIDPDSLEALVITEEESGGVAVSEQPAVASWQANA